MKSINGCGIAQAMIRVLAAGFLLVLSLAAPARAHVVQAGADLRVTQTFGAGEVSWPGFSTPPEAAS
ncbi:hypothetical protein [Nonomuraea dietziae]|uniref:hypothetical protein n=1 Tax=Nonomuraea dietziae TaxID=65515 RepID=UPI0034389494